MSAEGYQPGQAGDFSGPQDAGGGFAQGQAGDFGAGGQSAGGESHAASGGGGGWGTFSTLWKATTQLARDVGAGGIMDDMNTAANKVSPK